MNGSGYPRGCRPGSHDAGDRWWRAAVCYQSAQEPRQYREAMYPERSARRCAQGSARASLDAVAADDGAARGGSRVAQVPRPRPRRTPARERGGAADGGEGGAQQGDRTPKMVISRDKTRSTNTSRAPTQDRCRTGSAPECYALDRTRAGRPNESRQSMSCRSGQ